MFGVLKGQVIRPAMATHENTVLSRTDFVIPEAAMKEMGLNLGKTIPGGEYFDNAKLFNCPFGRSHDSSQRCRLTISFGSPVDTLVILYTLKQKSKNDKSSAAFLSEILLRSKCRCRTVDVRTRTITAPVACMPGACVQRDSTAKKTECDVLGKNWCSKDTMVQYMINGSPLSNDNLSCERLSGYDVRVESVQLSSDFVVLDDKNSRKM